MISSKKILEGCLLTVSRDTNEKWNLYLDGVEFSEQADPRFSKEVYSKLEYNQHLLPLYKLSGQYCGDLRSGLSSDVAGCRLKEENKVAANFVSATRNVGSFFVPEFPPEEEDWWKEVKRELQHTTLVIRDKQYVRIPSTKLVMGDIVYASAGDYLAADIRVIVCTTGAVVDLSMVTNKEYDKKELREQPTDMNPLLSGNVAPACSSVVEGMFFGMVIKTGEGTLFSKLEAEREKNAIYQQDIFMFKYPFVIKQGESLVKQGCSVGCYSVDVDTLLVLSHVSYVVLTIPYDMTDLCKASIQRLTRHGMHVILCYDMDTAYPKSMFVPENGQVNLSCRDNEKVKKTIIDFIESKTKLLGLIVNPAQCYLICKLLREEHESQQRVLFVGGNHYDHLSVMKITRVNISFIGLWCAYP